MLAGLGFHVLTRADLQRLAVVLPEDKRAAVERLSERVHIANNNALDEMMFVAFPGAVTV